MMRALSGVVGLASIAVAVAASCGAEERETGLIRHDEAAFKGYTLLAPLNSKSTHLIDMEGRVVHTWKSEYPPGEAAYLLENGHLLRCAREPDYSDFHGGGLGGRIEEFDWDGKLVWEFVYADEQRCQHHDIEPLPNGHVLIVAWERKTQAEAIAAGRDSKLVERGELWADHVVEIKPEGKRGGKIVWEWHVWDHLIQEFDESKDNFGVLKEHPELIDVNFDAQAVRLPPDELRRLRSLGYVGGEEPEEDEPRERRPRRRGPGPGGADWNHTNSIAYNAELDQIVLSVLGFNEVWVIDHSTTTEQAAGHSGGRCGRGGDLLYRWGNPQAYGAGAAADQQLFAQHDAQWIAAGYPGAGNLLVFNNGRGRRDGEYSSVDEIVPPIGKDGKYTRGSDGIYGPVKADWRYEAPRRADFFAGHISGAQRLPNGNTLICSGEEGRLFEVDRRGRKVWEYVNPFGGDAGPPHPPHGFGPRWGQPVPGWPGAGGPRPPGPWPGGGPGRGPGGPGEGTALFRAIRLAPEHAGLAGKDLSPKTVDE